MNMEFKPISLLYFEAFTRYRKTDTFAHNFTQMQIINTSTKKVFEWNSHFFSLKMIPFLECSSKI